jgi:hypothetical protein
MKKQTKKYLKLATAALSIFIFITVALAFCFIYDYGPINEISCFYFGVENPTYTEMKSFVKGDITRYNEYTSEYRCGHFSRDMISNARQEGMQAGYVVIIGDETDHAIVAFKTKDMGIYFVEPQTNYIFHETEMEYYLRSGTYSIRNKIGTFNMLIDEYRILWMFNI